MYIGYDNSKYRTMIIPAHRIWEWEEGYLPYLDCFDCNVSIWMVPGTVEC